MRPRAYSQVRQWTMQLVDAYCNARNSIIIDDIKDWPWYDEEESYCMVESLLAVQFGLSGAPTKIKEAKCLRE